MIFPKILELHTALALPPLNEMDGGWVLAIDNHWTMALNGSDSALTCSPPACMPVEVKPFHAAFWYNGWYAGALQPYVDADGHVGERGWIAAGEGANETTLGAALDAARQDVRQG